MQLRLRTLWCRSFSGPKIVRVFYLLALVEKTIPVSMAYSKVSIAWGGVQPQNVSSGLGLKNLGMNINILARGEGYDFFHAHREQEEVYVCLEGSADLLLGDPLSPEHVVFTAGDAIRVDAQTLRALGNLSSDRAVVLIAGACPHPYPANIDGHGVIADVAKSVGAGTTPFKSPSWYSSPNEDIDDDC